MGQIRWPGPVPKPDRSVCSDHQMWRNWLCSSAHIISGVTDRVRSCVPVGCVSPSGLHGSSVVTAVVRLGTLHVQIKVNTNFKEKCVLLLLFIIRWKEQSKIHSVFLPPTEALFKTFIYIIFLSKLIMTSYVESLSKTHWNLKPYFTHRHFHAKKSEYIINSKLFSHIHLSSGKLLIEWRIKCAIKETRRNGSEKMWRH